MTSPPDSTTAALENARATGTCGLLTAGITSTPFGRAVLAITDHGLCQFAFCGTRTDTDAWKELEAQWRGWSITRDDAAASAWARRVLAGEAALPLDVRGTPFQQRVWQALRAIPMGTTTSYGALAVAIGHPRACRAIGTAVGRNPIAVAIPCHRVLPVAGGIGNYRWGSGIKRLLLAREGIPIAGFAPSP